MLVRSISCGCWVEQCMPRSMVMTNPCIDCFPSIILLCSRTEDSLALPELASEIAPTRSASGGIEEILIPELAYFLASWMSWLASTRSSTLGFGIACCNNAVFPASSGWSLWPTRPMLLMLHVLGSLRHRCKTNNDNVFVCWWLRYFQWC